MHQPAPRSTLPRACLACSLLVLSISAQAQSSTDANVPPAVASQQAAEIARGDPARWHQEDATVDARLRTIRKEIGAALQENLGVCRAGPAPERAACNKEARATYQQEMAGAKARAASGQ
jgi:hypothetical protein